jgi:hypothetical protein
MQKPITGLPAYGSSCQNDWNVPDKQIDVHPAAAASPNWCCTTHGTCDFPRKDRREVGGAVLAKSSK